MTSLALALRTNAVRGLTRIQRAINLLKSAGPGAWYDPSDIASYTAPVGPELVPTLDFAAWSSTAVTAKSGGSFTTSASGGCWLTVPGWTNSKSYKLRLVGICPNDWQLRNADNSLNITSISAGAFDLDVPLTAVMQNSAGNLYFQVIGAATFTVTSMSLKELTGLSACTMFQDSAGTTPVTAVEQPVGLVLDKKTAGQVGSELILTNNATTTGATGWTAVDSQNVTAGKSYVITYTVVQSSGGLTISFAGSTVATHAGAVSGTFRVQNTPAAGGKLLVYSSASVGSITSISVREIPGAHLIQPTTTSRPTLSSRYNLIACSTGAATSWQQYNASVITPNYTAGPSGLEQAARVLTGGGFGTVRIPTGFGLLTSTQYRASVAIKSNTASSYDLAFQVGDGDILTAHVTPEWTVFSGVGSPAADGYNFIDLDLIPANSDISVCQVSIVTASDASLPYQRVNTTTDYDFNFAKFPPFLRFDGVDDSLYSAASVDFTSTDKMTVFAGVHKASDADVGMLAELSADAGSYNGTIQLLTPIAPGGNQIRFVAKGTAIALAVDSASPAPTTKVLTALADIAGERTTLRLNRAQVDQSTNTLGTGNFGNHTLFIGRRNNASLPLNGRLYQLAFKGKAMSDAEITTVEAYFNSKTKAY